MNASTELAQPDTRAVRAVQPAILREFDLIATAPNGVARLRDLILTLAMQGKLVPQLREEPPARELLKFLRAQKQGFVRPSWSKLDKALPPIADAEIPYELPAEWEWVRLGELAELITSGSRDWAKHYSSSGPVFVRMGNLSRGSYRMRMQNVQHVRPPAGSEGTRTTLQEGDLLVSITGEVGLLGLVPPELGEAYINQHTCLIRWFPCMRTEFMPVQLLSPLAQQQFAAPQRGIKNSFRLTDVAALLVALPPLQEQARIVARVGELMRLCHSLEGKLTALRSLQSRLAEALVQQVTRDST